LITLEQLTFGYKKPLLQEALNMKVDSPAVVAVLGNNGSGKSTFFNTLREKISFTGEIKIGSKKLSDFTVNPFVFLGQGYSFGLEIDVETFLKINVSNDSFNQEVYKFLYDSLKIGLLKNNSITELSQGQLQRCLIVQTLIQESEFFLLDEPESFLDLHFRNLLATTLKEFAEKFNKTILLATHDLDLVNTSCTQLINFSFEKPQLKEVTKTNIEENRIILLR